VQTTITLATSLGMRTVAEGVETQEEVDVLKELGCDALQGYLIHRPASAPEIGKWLATAGSDASGRLVRSDPRTELVGEPVPRATGGRVRRSRD